MHDGPIELNIGNICGGAVPELFDHEIARIMKNIADLNTDPEEKRSLVLEFKFKPSPDRKSAVVCLQCKSKVAGVNPVAGSVPEVIQPQSVFLFRARGGSPTELPKLALFEADGGKWRTDAVENIARNLRVLLGDAKNIPIVS